MKLLRCYCFSLFFLIIPIGIIAQNFDKKSLINQDVDDGNYLLALKKIKDVLKTDSLNAQLWYETGKLQQFTQKYRAAITSFKKSYELDSLNSKSLFALARTYRLAGRVNSSISNYERFLVKEPLNMAALTNLAAIYNGRHKPAKAFVLYAKLFNLDTLNTEYLRKMARCKRSMSEILVAFNMLKKAYKIDSTNLNVVYDLTKIYTDSEMFDSTILLVNKTLKLYSNEGGLYARRGRAHFRKNHHFRCVPDFEKALELGYRSTLLIKSLGKSLYSLKRYAEAKVILDQLLVKDTMDHQVCMYMGYIHNELNNADSAILFFDKALDIITPEEFVVSAVYRGKQASYSKKGMYYKEIEMILKRQKAMTGRFFSNHYLLEIAEIYETKIKDKKKAIKYYSKFYEQIKEANWYSEEKRNAIETKINRLREDLHFER